MFVHGNFINSLKCDTFTFHVELFSCGMHNWPPLQHGIDSKCSESVSCFINMFLSVSCNHSWFAGCVVCRGVGDIVDGTSVSQLCCCMRSCC